ncbi:MAG: hypothetical protein M3135_05350 [Actinomycetota bacterium]|nr:hypothetical protein [Actinomycetota bacterium]
MKRQAGIVLAAAALVILMSGPALGGPSPYPASPSPSPSPGVQGTVTVSDRTIDCGSDSLTVSGRGWNPGQQVTISFAGEQIGTATPNAQGDFSAQVVPPDAPSGEHTLRAEQGPNQATASVTCTDGAVGAAGAGGGIAFTGANILTAVLILAGLLIAGVLTLRAGRLGAVIFYNKFYAAHL